MLGHREQGTEGVESVCPAAQAWPQSLWNVRGVGGETISDIASGPSLSLSCFLDWDHEKGVFLNNPYRNSFLATACHQCMLEARSYCPCATQVLHTRNWISLWPAACPWKWFPASTGRFIFKGWVSKDTDLKSFCLFKYLWSEGFSRSRIYVSEGSLCTRVCGGSWAKFIHGRVWLNSSHIRNKVLTFVRWMNTSEECGC